MSEPSKAPSPPPAALTSAAAAPPSSAHGPTVFEGLEGVMVTRTETSLVDGARGRLVIAGHDVEQLAKSHSFEEVTALLWKGDADVVAAAIAEGRQRAFECLPRFARSLEISDAMDALRAAVAQLPPAFAAEPAWMVGAVGVVVPAHRRIMAGQAPIAPSTTRGHAADVLAMFGPADASLEDAADLRLQSAARALDAYLTTVIDHGLNASTFTARVVASTGSDLVSAITAAIGALKGPLHGGAPGPVLDMLDAIGTPERAAPWLEGELAARRRIMGMGHRVYRVRDPRALVLEGATVELERAGVRTHRLSLARAVEKAAHEALKTRYPERELAANVEFYTAVLLDAVGIPRRHFSATFAIGRVAGWCAHVAEQRVSGRLIRPDSLYIGAIPEA